MKKILVIDDEPSILVLVTSRLKSKGFEVITANDGDVGFEMTTNQKPDLVLLDIMMPNMNGYVFLEKLKDRPEIKSIPIIMLTAKAQQEDIDRAMKLGAKDAVIKPFTPEILIEKVQKAFKT